ncbi:hypothetical protein LXL04_015439 [Taraxacum kok-saghyz]
MREVAEQKLIGYEVAEQGAERMTSSTVQGPNKGWFGWMMAEQRSPWLLLGSSAEQGPNTKSQTGYVFMNGGTVISRRSKKQTLVTTSSNHDESDMTKHIPPKYFEYIQELINDQKVEIEYVQSSNNAADLFTKSLPTAIFRKHVHAIRMRHRYVQSAGAIFVLYPFNHSELLLQVQQDKNNRDGGNQRRWNFSEAKNVGVRVDMVKDTSENERSSKTKYNAKGNAEAEVNKTVKPGKKQNIETERGRTTAWKQFEKRNLKTNRKGT